MAQNATGNSDITRFVSSLNLPLEEAINKLRAIVLGAHAGLAENIKWNSPNYVFEEKDRITMRIQPSGKIGLVFHCGAKVREQPINKLIPDASGLLQWKANDRAVVFFKGMQDITAHQAALDTIIKQWLAAAL